MANDVQGELLALTKLQPKAGESAEVFTARVFKKLNSMVDANEENWRELSDDAQGWVNQNTIAQENGQPLTLLTIPEAEEDPAPENDSASTEETDEQEESVEESASTKAKSGKVTASKKVASSKKVAEPKKAAAKPATPPKAAAPKKAAAAKADKAKPAKAAKAAKPAKENGADRGRKSSYAPDQTIKLLVDENPHSKGTGRYKRWSLYKNGMTVAQALKAGLKTENLRYSVLDGHIKIA